MGFFRVNEAGGNHLRGKGLVAGRLGEESAEPRVLAQSFNTVHAEIRYNDAPHHATIKHEQLDTQ